MATLARTALLLVTVLVACFALAQAGGRLLFANLAKLEDRVNASLAEEQISIEGLAGSWRHLNPSVAAARVRFAGGELEGVDFELDVLESLWRNRLVARRLHVESGRLGLVRTPSGWRLGAEAGQMQLDQFFRHSDELKLAGRIELQGLAATGAIHAEVTATNRGDRHRWRAMLVPQGSGRSQAGCGCVLLDLDLTGGGGQPAGAGRFLADGVSVWGELARALALPDFRLDMEGRWTGDGDRAAVVAEGRMSGGTAWPMDVMVTTVARAVASDSMYRGVASVRAAAGESAVAVEGIQVYGDGDGVGLWLEDIDVAAVNTLLASGLATHGHWFDGIAAAGRMHAIRGRLDGRGFAYEARLDGISMSNYRGVPEVANGCGMLRGHLRSLRIEFSCDALRFGLPKQFEDSWDFDVASGDITFWFDRGYLGARGDVELALGGAAVGGGFSLTRPRDPLEGRFVLLALADAVPVDSIKRSLPQDLGAGLKDWLKSSLTAGQLNAASTVYHGHTRTRPGLPNRRFELAGLMVDGTVDYHERWPAAEALRGNVTITGKEVRARVAEGTVAGGAIDDSTLVAQVGGGYVDIALRARAKAEDVLDFVRTTPLAEELRFVAPSWRGDGALGIEGGLKIPIGEETHEVGLDLAFQLDDVALDLADLGLLFTDLNGSARFQSPHYLSAAAIEGSLFDFPVHISSVASEAANVLDFRGTGTVADVLRVLKTQEFPAAGPFGFNAQFRAFVEPSRAPELTIESDGVGIAVDLPPPLGKSAEEPRRLDVELAFGDDYTRMDARGERFAGWFHTRDGDLVRGAIGIGVPTGRPDISASDIRLSGQMKSLRIGDRSALLPPSVPWRLDQLASESVWLGEIELTDVMLNGVAAGQSAAIEIESNEVRGSVVVDGEKPLLVALDEVRIPAGESDEDLLDVSMFDQIPDADVTIAKTLLGDDDHGAWRFGIRRGAGVIRLTDLVGDIKGMRIEADDDLLWTRESDMSRFSGRITAADLARVLPMWGYAPSVESDSVDIEAMVEWRGSPLNFDLGALSGSMQMAVDAGRFLEVDEAAGARIFALLDFTNIARRLTLDFSDLFKRGIGFDHVRGTGALDEGVLSFVEPMEIHGPSSDFKINGTVDLADGTLNNEMIVTLPLSSSLPWYAVWLAASQPVSAVGVLVGRELFKDQIDTLSSAKYRITGTIEEPNAEFVDIFNSDMEQPEPGEAE